MQKYVMIVVGVALCVTIGCRHSSNSVQFELLDSSTTGVDFVNALTPSKDFNMFNYMYFYNGAGVGAGDFNNDGLVDLFFASNQGQDRMYLNQSALHFKDVTKESAIPDDGGWSTGVSIVDINNDGLLDIYVCRVAGFGPLKVGNLLLVCQEVVDGTPLYKNEADKYGLAFTGFSTQAAFFDFDRDGDLDVFLLNHAIHHNGNFAKRERFLGTYDDLSGDRFFLNKDGYYLDWTKESGIHSSIIGYGLGVVVTDVDGDGWPDIYVGNDFHENDYLYINQQGKSFKDELPARMQHTSQFSMGVDAGDVDNDGRPEIISVDMLPSDPEILKRSLGEDEYNLYMMKVAYGYHYQYARNNFQKNTGNGTFSEIGFYAGIAATDWSWGPLWADFDNDGKKDLFISNGIPRRLNDIDYVNFITNDRWQEKIRKSDLSNADMSIIEQFPQIKLDNFFYKNNGHLKFSADSFIVANGKASFSNGGVVVDLDHDGDLDIVTNNIGDPAFIYENKQNLLGDGNFVNIRLKGSVSNQHAIGAKVFMFQSDSILLFEQSPVRGFQSSVVSMLTCGVGNAKIDSILVVWPDNTYETRHNLKLNSTNDFSYRTGLTELRPELVWPLRPVLTADDITTSINLKIKHEENRFVEFNREPLIPFMVSTEGPALAVADINEDGLDDFFIGSSKGFQSHTFIQTQHGVFKELPQPALRQDSMYEEVDAIWIDVNADQIPDLVTGSGGNEYYGKDTKLFPRLYLNNGKGMLTLLPEAFSNVFSSASCIIADDFNNDGVPDLFIGGRSVPYDYGKVPKSYFLINDGSGKFRDSTAEIAPSNGYLGLVKNASFFDIDKDGDKDLLLAMEWSELVILENKDGKFVTRKVFPLSGWWNFLVAADVNNDGLPDLIAGNQGQNNRLNPSTEKPVRLYFNDFDNNGKAEQLLTYYVGSTEHLFASKMELEKQLPYLKKKFLYAGDFAQANLNSIIATDLLNNSLMLTAQTFTSGYLINKGNWQFEWFALPDEVQWSPFRTVKEKDVNGDGFVDLLVGSNFFSNNIQMGRNDALSGGVLINQRGNGFVYRAFEKPIQGQIRRFADIQVGERNATLIARNNDSLLVFTNWRMLNKP